MKQHHVMVLGGIAAALESSLSVGVIDMLRMGYERIIRGEPYQEAGIL